MKVKRTCIAPLMKLHLKALRYGSHRITPANYTIPASTLRTFARSPSEWQTSNSSSLLIYRPRKDERLSWPSWLTYSGRYTLSRQSSRAHVSLFTRSAFMVWNKLLKALETETEPKRRFSIKYRLKPNRVFAVETVTTLSRNA